MEFFKLKFHAHTVRIIQSVYILMHSDAYWCILLHLNRLKCINMHPDASICILMHENACRMNYFNVLCKKFQFEKFHFFDQNRPIFFLSAQNASLCIRMHQNVCRMNCANVLYTKLSKQWFLSHLKGLKLTKYICHFVVENPVFTVCNRAI